MTSNFEIFQNLFMRFLIPLSFPNHQRESHENDENRLGDVLLCAMARRNLTSLQNRKR